MEHSTTESGPPEVAIRVADDDDARKIMCILEALGFDVTRDLDEGEPAARLRWAATRLGRRHMLTSRELDLVKLVLDGHDIGSACTTLEISRATGRWHMGNIYAKTNTHSREDLLRVALQLGPVKS